MADAITGEPIAGAFLVTDFFSANFAGITAEQWDLLNALPSNPSPGDVALRPIMKLSWDRPKHVFRADDTGAFGVTFKESENVRSLIAVQKDYMPVSVSLDDVGPKDSTQRRLPVMRMLPAGKVKIYPCIEELNNGRPCIEAANVIIDFRLAAVEHDSSPAASVFYNMYRSYDGEPLIFEAQVVMNEEKTYLVPAGMPLRIEWNLTGTDRWVVPKISQIIHVKQGEELDLGRFVFEPLGLQQK